MNPYEMTFIIRPDLDEEQTRVAVDSVTGRITAQGGELIATYPWNPPRRRLAYPIRDFGDGYYMTTVFQFDPDGLKEFERGLRLNTGVLRFLILQATELNITQGQQRAQQAAARAAAPQAAPAAGQSPAAPQPAAPAQPTTAPAEAAPSIEQVAPSPELEEDPQPEAQPQAQAEAQAETQPEAEPEPVAAAPSGDTQE